MDIFWIFIVIFGIVVSIGQKASKQQAPKDNDEEPTLTPEQEDIERRIRELLEGKKPSQPSTLQPSHSTPAEHRPATSTQKSSTATQKTTAKATAKQAASNTNIDPIKQNEIKKGEIGQIVKDFTIEKAVIYSEIMKPKYEDY